MAATAGRAGLVGEILSAYRDLDGSIGAKLDQQPRDAQLLVLAFVAALVGFVAGLPSAREQALELAEPDALAGVLTGRLFAAVFLTPLLLFAIAALSHVAARAFGGQGDFRSARIALIWAVVVALPLLVASAALSAVLAALAAPAGPALAGLVSALAALGFAWIWAVFLSAAEAFRAPVRVVSVILLIPALLLIFSLLTRS